jgi:hypothetical protein
MGTFAIISASEMIVLMSPTAKTGSLVIGVVSLVARLFIKRIIESGKGTDSHLSLEIIFIVFNTRNFTLPDSDPVGYKAIHDRVLSFIELSGYGTSHWQYSPKKTQQSLLKSVLMPNRSSRGDAPSDQLGLCLIKLKRVTANITAYLRRDGGRE